MATKVSNGLDLQNQKIINVGDPSANTDVANKQYVDGVARGLEWHQHVRAVPTTNITIASPGTTADGVTLAAGDRLLLINQSTGSENGIWTWNASGSTLVRPADYAPAQVFTKGSVTVTVTEGTVSADKVYTMTTDGTVTVDSTATAWAQVGGGSSYTAGNGLQLIGSAFSVLANGSSIDVSASGVKIASAAAGAGLTESSGVLAVGAGTGVTVNANDVAVDTAVVVRKFAANIGDGSTNPLVVTHSLGTTDVTVALYEVSTNDAVIADITDRATNTVTLTFATTPTTNQYRIVVHA